MKLFCRLTFSIVLLFLSSCISVNRAEKKVTPLPLDDIKLPTGFEISIFAEGIDNARSLALGTQGTIFASTRNLDRVYALLDTDQDGKADQSYVVAKGLKVPNGLAFRDEDLYIAEIDKIWRLEGIEDRLANPPSPVLVADGFPDDRMHGWKYLGFGPEGKLYMPIGAPCNICEREKEMYSTILRMNPDGSEQEIFAEGIRNSVGFDWHPETQELWFTENGRDMLGDDIPNDELNHAPREGLHFGYPYCHAGDIPDPRYGKGKRCGDYRAPVQKLGPHVAALGMKFYTGEMFPKDFKKRILIAEHGSWNRKIPIGYRLTMVSLDGDRSLGYEVFAEGWLREGEAWGRPVDLLQLPDGSLLVSDDFADVIYRITYQQKG